MKNCRDCVHYDTEIWDDACNECGPTAKNFKEKDDDMENENRNATATIDTEAELKEQVAKLQANLDEANEYIDELNQKLQTARTELAVMRGMVDGLKFAMRCNGVSGGEVR